MANCAACLRIIYPGAKFALAGTEVFHRECAPNIANSIGTRQKLEIVRLSRTVATEQQEAARLRAALTDAERTVDARLAEQARVFNADARKIRRERDEALRDARSVETVRRHLERETAAAEAARAEASQLRTLLELARVLAEGSAVRAPVTSSTPVTGATDVTPTKDDRDDAEQRFSLLELDPLK